MRPTMRVAVPAVLAVLAPLAAIAGEPRRHEEVASDTSVTMEGLGLPLTVGSKVRVRTGASAEPVVGLVVAVDDHVLTLAGREGAPMRIPRGSISVAEMSVGRRGHALQGLAIGAGAGLAVGLAVPVDPVRCKFDSAYLCSRGEALALGILADGGLGALIGHLVKTDRWGRVDVRAGIEQGPAGFPPAAAPPRLGPGSPAASCAGVVGARPIAAGERVRVFAPAVSEGAIVGQFMVSDEATITIVRAGHGGPWPFGRDPEGTLTMPRESITRFERSLRPSRRGLGAKIGLGVGWAVGIVIVERSNKAESCDQCGIAAAIIGSPLALVGYAVAPGERWAEEDSGKACAAHSATEDPKDPRKVRFGIGPTHGGGVGVRLSVAF